MIPNLKAVIFDLDGTLLDTETLSDKAIIQAFGDSIPEHVRQQPPLDNWSIPWEIKRPTLGLRGADWIPMVLNFAQDHWGVAAQDIPPLKEFWDRWETNLNNLCPQVEACAGAAELVEQLYMHKVPLAIATSSRRAAVDKKRQRHETMFQRMSHIVTGDDPAIKNGKPAPDMYIEAARLLGVQPNECLVLEDAMSGVKAGKAAGCAVIAVPDPRMEKSLFTPVADVVLDDLWQFDARQWGIHVNMNKVRN